MGCCSGEEQGQAQCSALMRQLLDTLTEHRHHRGAVALTVPGTAQMNRCEYGLVASMHNSCPEQAGKAERGCEETVASSQCSQHRHVVCFHCQLKCSGEWEVEGEPRDFFS